VNSCTWDSEWGCTTKRDLTLTLWPSVLHPQVLQKLGKTVETKDERFEQSASNFYQQQVIGRAGKERAWERRHEDWVAEEYRFCKPTSILSSSPSPQGTGPQGDLLLILPLGFGGQRAVLFFLVVSLRTPKVQSLDIKVSPWQLSFWLHLPRVPFLAQVSSHFNSPMFFWCLFVYCVCST
jgi:hypothetical protein